MSESGKGFFRGYDATDYGGQQRDESDEIISPPSPDQEREYKKKQGEQDYLVGRQAGKTLLI